MSGHSKWAGIKHKKGAIDAKRGKIFTRHAKLVEIAAREGGGGDSDTNPTLRNAIESAREDDVPNANIERAIRKGIGELKGETQTVEMRLEAFGPAGTAYIVECLTDNRNRTIANVKYILNRHDGRLTETGAVGWMFEQKGIVVVEIGEKSEEELELLAIDAGAEDVTVEGSSIVVTTKREEWGKVRDALKKAGCAIHTADLQYIASQEIDIGDITLARKVLNLMTALEEDEDVRAVHTNANISEEIAKEL